MFLDKLSKRALNAIGIISAIIATIMLILVIVIPILMKRKYKNDYIQKCNPSMENTDIWASFPGKLNSKLTHNFSFIDYETDKIKLKYNISLEEDVKYINFSQEDTTIFFRNNRTYTKKSQENEDTPLRSINLGMFEAFETLTYPPLYKLGIDSIYYLLKKFFIEPDLFIRELFAYNLSTTLSKDSIRENILKNIPYNKAKLILYNSADKYQKYSLNSSPGFFEWIKILGSKEKISESQWLFKLFLLTESEINSILLNEDSYLIKEYENYNKFLAEKFKCEDESKCGYELLYKQLIDSSVLSDLFSDKIDFKQLNSYLKTDYYPFENSPEMKIYFNKEYSQQKGHKTNYEDVAVNINQLKKFIINSSDFTLLSVENSVEILHINKTADSKADTKYYEDLTYDKVNFLTEYFYNYLPRLFLYYQKNPDEINPEQADDLKSFGLLPKTISNFLPKIAEKTFDKMSNVNLFLYLAKKLTYVQLKEVLQVDELEEICPIIMQKSLDDGQKVFQVCSDDNVNFMDETSFFKYVQLYYCQEDTKDESLCDNSIADYLKKIIYISDDEIKSLVTQTSYIGQAIDAFNLYLKNKYNCLDKCDNYNLLRIQYAKARITRDPPEVFVKGDGLKDWFPELEDNYEIINIVEKYGNNETFEEQDALWILDSRIKNGEIFDFDNSFAFENKIHFEQEYSKGLLNDKESSLYKLIEFLLKYYVFDVNDKNNFLFVNYASIDNFLEGNSDENKYWIDYLKSGNYFDNFNPKIEKVTKFDFGFNFEKGEQKELDLDYIGISTKTSGFNKRRITNMNNLLTLNIKKEDYDIIKDSYVKLAFPLYNFQRLTSSRIFSDGFQYDNSLDIIYYYDLISSRPFRFRKKDDVKYKDKVECKKYVLDTETPSAEINEFFDQKNKNPMITQKVNKPFMLKVDYKEELKKYGYDNEDNLPENYICVDPISDMVIDSKMNFMYSINPRKYGILNQNIGKDETYPLFLYKRIYEVDVDSYAEQFPGVTEYYENYTAFIVIGVIIIVLFAVIAFVAFFYLNKKTKEDINESKVDPILPGSTNDTQ